MANNLIDLGSDAQFSEIINSNKLVIVDFWAEWCGPCKVMKPRFEELSQDASMKDIVFLKVNVDVTPNSAQQFRIMSIPTIKFFKDGKSQNDYTMVGVKSIDDLKEFILKCSK